MGCPHCCAAQGWPFCPFSHPPERNEAQCHHLGCSLGTNHLGHSPAGSNACISSDATAATVQLNTMPHEGAGQGGSCFIVPHYLHNDTDSTGVTATLDGSWIHCCKSLQTLTHPACPCSLPAGIQDLQTTVMQMLDLWHSLARCFN